MRHVRQQQHPKLRRSKYDTGEGIDFVRCRICGDHRRVISRRHLSKHETDRETYMQEYRLSPDQLCAKDFRRLISTRPGYYPHGKRDWIAAIKKIYKCDGQVFAGYIQKKYPHIYYQGVWIFRNWDNGLCAAGFDPESSRKWEPRGGEKFSLKYATCAKTICRSIRLTS